MSAGATPLERLRNTQCPKECDCDLAAGQACALVEAADEIERLLKGRDDVAKGRAPDPRGEW